MSSQDPIASAATTLLRTEGLTVSYATDFGNNRVLEGVDFELRSGETVALVGESGSGKTTLANALLGLLPRGAEAEAQLAQLGTIKLMSLGEKGWRQVRGKRIALIPQNPMSGLNPVLRIGKQLIEVLRLHRSMTRSQARSEAVRLLEITGLLDADRRLGHYPFQLSGGQQQRVLIALALAAEPEIIIADEPTSALDVTLQQQILDRLQELVRQGGSALLLITHDLALAADRADQVLVLHRGIVVERGEARRVLGQPEHPYTRDLVAAVRELRRPATLAAEPETESLPQSAPGAVVLEANNLSKVFSRSKRKATLRRVPAMAVDRVSLQLRENWVTALVGESGAGKSTIARVMLGLVKPSSGTVALQGTELRKLSRAQRRVFRRSVQAVFQDPFSSLNPARTIANIVQEPLRIQGLGTALEQKLRMDEILQRVGLDPQIAGRYPQELSGGQRQRVAIARALMSGPRVLIVDEPVSALDIITQHQILQLLRELKAEYGLSMLLISHDLGIVRAIADEVLVLHEGRIIESGAVKDVFERPEHPITSRMIEAIPGALFGS